MKYGELRPGDSYVSLLNNEIITIIRVGRNQDGHVLLTAFSPRTGRVFDLAPHNPNVAVELTVIRGDGS